MYCKKIGRECLYYKECNLDSKTKTERDTLIRTLLSSESFIEDIWLKNGTRHVRKIENVSFSDIPKLQEKYSHYKNMVYSYQSKEKDGYTVLLWKNEHDLKKFVVYDLDTKYYNRVVWTGLLLWYPQCCIMKHACEIQTSKDEDMCDKNWKDIFEEDWLWCKLLSKSKRLYAHKPCSATCKKTIDICEKNLSSIKQDYGYKYVESFFNI